MRRLLLAAPMAAFFVQMAHGQMPLPAAAPQDGATLFRNQCGTCHSLNPADPPRQGPLLKGVFGRHAGTLPGFKYSAGFAKADWNWDEDHLATWLENPQAMIPGAIMVYRQAKPDIRKTIIGYLKEQQ